MGLSVLKFRMYRELGLRGEGLALCTMSMDVLPRDARLRAAPCLCAAQAADVQRYLRTDEGF